MSVNGPTVLLRFKSGRTLNSENFGDFAKGLISVDGKLKYPKLTTSKLRGIYGMITNIYSKLNEPEDFDKCKSDLQYLKVKMAYECGRSSDNDVKKPDDDVKKFIEGTYLMDAIDRIDSYETFMLYCRYAESLVAYFKFYGGKDQQ